MREVGIAATVVVCAVAVVAIIAVVMSLPDIRRYMRIRRM